MTALRRVHALAAGLVAAAAACGPSGTAAPPAPPASGMRFYATPSVVLRDINNKKTIAAVSSDGQLAQFWDHENRWQLDLPAQLAGAASIRFSGAPAMIVRDPVSHRKAIFALTSDGRLAHLWDGEQWRLGFPAEEAGRPELRFVGSPVALLRDAGSDTKVVLVVTSDGRLAQLWNEGSWRLDFPAERTNQPGLRFQPTPSAVLRDPYLASKIIVAVTSDGRLAQLWDQNGWMLDFPAEQAGLAHLRFGPGPAVALRDAIQNRKTILAVTSDGQLVQLWDDPRWRADFPAQQAGWGHLRFLFGPAMVLRDPQANRKTVLALTSDGRLAQLWDDGPWLLDFPAERAGYPHFRFLPGPAATLRSTAANQKTVVALTADGRLTQLWDDSTWHLDFPAESAAIRAQ